MTLKQRPKPRPYNPRGVPFSTRLVDANGSFSLAVDGSVNPVEFDFEPDDDHLVTELALIFEADGRVAFGDNFAQLKGALANGIGIELQTQGVDVAAGFKTTRDLLEYASPEGFYVSDVDGGEAGKTIVKATRRFTRGLTLVERRGDHIKLVVKDNLSGFSYAIASVLGYTI